MDLHRRMANTPEGAMQRRQAREQFAFDLETLSHRYVSQAESALKDGDVIVRDEVARFAKEIMDARLGLEQYDRIDTLLNRIRSRPGIFDRIPDEVKDRRAFALALARKHIQSLQ